MTTADPGVEQVEEALKHQDWEEAYELLSGLDRDQRLEPDMLPTLAEAAYLAGDPEAAIGTWERVHAAAVEAHANERAADAAAQIATLLLYAGLLSPLRGWTRRAEDLLLDHPGSPVHGALAIVLAWTAVLSGDLEKALEEARRAVDIGSRLGEPAIRVLGRNAEARILIFQGHLQEGLALLDESAVAAASGELDPMSTALLYCSTVCAFQGLAEYDRAEEWTMAMQRWIRGYSAGGFHGLCRVHRAEILRLRGEWAEAEVEALGASEELRRFMRSDAGWPMAELGQIRLRMGNLAGAQKAFQEARELGWDPNPGWALLRLAQGDLEGAADSIVDSLENQPAVASLEGPPNTELRRAPLLAAQAEIAVAGGELGLARQAAEDLDRTATVFGSKALKASAATVIGALRLAEGEIGGARHSFHEGMHVWTEVGAPYESARSRMGLGLALRAAGNERQAILEFRAAQSTFERLGAELDAHRAAEAAGGAEPDAGARMEKVFLFTDIVESTNLAEVLGDEAWGHLVRWHNSTLASIVAAHDGDVVRTTGDGFFVTFDTPGAAIECAVAIQRALEKHRREHGFAPGVRIGMHRSDATREGSDWSGKGVHAAARIGALAEGGEILASRETAEAAGGMGIGTSNPRTVSLKGLFDPVEVVALEWR